jgi:uncharacterized protein (TIGR03435 family)
MAETNDMDLLREYAFRNSEPAFETLVNRHIGLVYSVALRQVDNPAQAEEITQAVFLILARKASRLKANTVLAGWLHETARFVAASFRRGEWRRRWREQEAYMQSKLQEPESDPLWEKLAPFLDEAIGDLSPPDRDAIVLRFFQNKSAREIAAVLNVHESAAQKRLNRAVEKLRAYFLKHGLAVPAATLSGAVPANLLPSTPVHLAASVSAAAAKGAVINPSTHTLIQGALKLMAWTKTKIALTAGAGLLLAAGTTAITLTEIQAHHTYPWQVHEGFITDDQMNQPPQVRILPSKFHTPDWANGNGKMVGTGVQARDVVAAAYGFITPARLIVTTKLPETRYDYIACLAGDESANETALQTEVFKKFGVRGRRETRDTDVWLLRIKNPNAPALRRNTETGNNGNGFSARPGGFHGWNERMYDLAYSIEDRADFPVIDDTQSTERYDFDLNCRLSDLKNQNFNAINTALNQLGLELVPTNLPLETLVVDKAG